MRPPSALAAVAVAVALALGACGGSSDGGSTPAPPAVEPIAGADEWRTDFANVANGVHVAEFVRAVPFRDAIPALDAPDVVPVGAVDWIGPAEPVIAVEAGGAWRAYPLQILLWHEIANDVLGGRPIAVTFCPLCHTAVVFDRRLDGRTLEFGVSGYLRRSDLVMYDRASESWWQQATGMGLVGGHAGRQLEIMPSSLVAWSTFRSTHPEATVVSRATGHDRPYGHNPYPGWDRITRNPFLGDAQLEPCNGAAGCLDPKERVGVVSVGGETVVYPFRAVAEAGGLVLDTVGEVPVAVWWLPDVTSVLDNELLERNHQVGTLVAFDRRAAGRVPELQLRGGLLRDPTSGAAWNELGRAVGQDAGSAPLRRLQLDTPYWFGFAAFGSGFRIWGPEA